MNQTSGIPEPSDELMTEWATRVITSSKIAKSKSLEDIVYQVARFFEEEFPDYRITTYNPDKGENSFNVIKYDNTDEGILDIFLDSSEKPTTEEEKMMVKYVRRTYLKILSVLQIDNPTKHTEILADIGLGPFDKEPNFREEAFKFWGKKISSYYKITKKTSVEDIINSVIRFFNLLFPNYYIYYSESSRQNQLPIYIKRKTGDTLMYLSETDKIRRIMYATYYKILEELKRGKENPKDPNFWFDLVLVYETIGQREKAKVLGEIGLVLEIDDLFGLTELFTYYSENKRLAEGLKYVKKVGQYYKDKKDYKLALNTWKTITNFEPRNKENWVILAEIHTEIGNKSEAKTCEEKAQQL